jgi:hypothetical protein
LLFSCLPPFSFENISISPTFILVGCKRKAPAVPWPHLHLLLRFFP